MTQAEDVLTNQAQTLPPTATARARTYHWTGAEVALRSGCDDGDEAAAALRPGWDDCDEPAAAALRPAWDDGDEVGVKGERDATSGEGRVPEAVEESTGA